VGWDAGMAARIAEHRSIKYIRSSDHNNCAMRAWHSMSRYGARYPLVAAYCMLHVSWHSSSQSAAMGRRVGGPIFELLLFFSSCPRPIGKNSYKCLMKTVRARLWISFCFTFCFSHATVTTARARGDRSRDPGTRQTDPWRAESRTEPRATVGWHGARRICKPDSGTRAALS